MPPQFKDYSKAVKMFNDGMQVAEIARRFGTSRQNMTMILERRGCIRRKKKKEEDKGK